jgi:hypothetical protein
LDDLDKPTRIEPPAAVENRLVREAMAEVAVGIEELQREAAFLNAIAGRPGAKPDVRPLRREVEAAKTRLELAVAKLPGQLRNHGRITDLRKAIASLEGLLLAASR